jgi:hypothetical protein
MNYHHHQSHTVSTIATLHTKRITGQTYLQEDHVTEEKREK